MGNGQDIILKPCDIFLTRGNSFLGRAIRFFTRTFGEKWTHVNHVGMVVERGTLKTSIVVEALSRVVKHKLWDEYGPPSKDLVAIYRPTNLTDDEMSVAAFAAKCYVGRQYGYLKIIAHLLDWFLLGAYVFRRLTRMDKYPICSWVVAQSFAKIGKNFGVPPGAANPDDIWDFVTKNPDKYSLIHPLKKLQDKQDIKIEAQPELVW